MSQIPEEEGVQHPLEEDKGVVAKIVAIRSSYGFQNRLWERGDKGFLYKGETLPVSKIAPLFLVDGIPQELAKSEREIKQEIKDRLAPRDTPPVLSQGKHGRKPREQEE